MKIALQIYGEFRCFEKCLPDILYFIDYSNHEFDVFILTQRNSNSYSIKNLNKIKDMLGREKIKNLKYIEDYSNEIMEKENNLVKQYFKLYNKFKGKFNDNLICNEFVTRLWFRRYLNNQMRIEYEKTNNKKYDYVVRTRFDIGLLNKKVFDYFTLPYFCYDTISIATPEIINIESNLGLEFPFTPRYMYDENVNIISNKKFIKEIKNLEINHPMWVFMSEANLILYLMVNAGTTHRHVNDFNIMVVDNNGRLKKKY